MMIWWQTMYLLFSQTPFLLSADTTIISAMYFHQLYLRIEGMNMDLQQLSESIVLRKGLWTKADVKA